MTKMDDGYVPCLVYISEVLSRCSTNGNNFSERCNKSKQNKDLTGD